MNAGALILDPSYQFAMHILPSLDAPAGLLERKTAQPLVHTPGREFRHKFIDRAIHPENIADVPGRGDFLGDVRQEVRCNLCYQLLNRGLLID